jgi:hypothetical protein
MALQGETSVGEEREPQASYGLSLRAVCVGLASALLVVFVTTWAELVVRNIAIGILQFPPASFGVFVLVILLNRLIRLRRPRWALRPAELAVVYVMMLLSAMTASRGAPPRLIGLLTALNYYANPANNWQSIFFAHIPRELVPWNPDGQPLQPTILAFFEGLHNGEPIPWQPWLGPLARWLAVVLLVFGAFISLATLLRAQWSDNERLSFPLAQLPIEMLRAEEGGAFYRNRLLYLGAGLPVVIHLINLWHNINPDVPQVKLMWDLQETLLRTPPWNALSTTRLYLPLSAVGFFFLLPKELLFSFWFFYLFLAKGHELVFVLLGMTLERPGHADTSLYMASAEAGGFFVLAGYFIYLARPLLLSAIRKGGGYQEMMPYRAALAGLVVFIVAAALWYVLAGLSLWLALMELIVYVVVISLVMARATAEGGLLMTEVVFTPLDAYGMLGRRQLLGAQNLTAIVFATNPFAGDMRGLALQGMMDGQKIGDAVGLRRRSLMVAFWIAIALAVVSGFVIQLWISYRRGALLLNTHYNEWFATLFFQEHAAFLNGEERFNAGAPLCFILGAVFTVLLSALRLRFWWWPLHPLGFVMCGSWSLVVYWFAMFLAWLAKSVIVHYGGLSGYAKARPFFMGLVMGEMTIAVLLTLVDAIWHVPAPYIPFD